MFQSKWIISLVYLSKEVVYFCSSREKKLTNAKEVKCSYVCQSKDIICFCYHSMEDFSFVYQSKEVINFVCQLKDIICSVY